MKHLISQMDLKNDETQNSDQTNTTSAVTKVKPISVNTQDAKILVEILQIPTDQRKSEHIQIMKECLRKVKFLQSYQDSSHYGEVLKNLELENCNLDHILFRQGDFADKFYIILNGIIGLYIRTQNDADMILRVEQNPPQDKNKSHTQLNENEKNQDKKNEVSPTKSTRRSIVIQQKAEGSQSVNLLGVGVREVARLESGDAFGELGLLFNENRTATAVCLDSTSLLVLKKEVFEKYLSQSKNAKISIMVDFYTNLWHMRDMQQKEILKLATKTTLTQCSKDTIIIKQGEKPKGIFFVRNGIVKLISTLKFRVDPQTFNILDDYRDPTPEENRSKRFKTIDVQLDEIGNGNLFGDYEVFNNLDIPYTAISATDCDILTITQQDLKSSVPPDVFKQFMSSIKHYPSTEKIKRQYIENIMWNNYKNDIVQSFNNELVNSIRQANIFSHRLPFLPKVTLSKYQIYDEVSNSLSQIKEKDSKKKTGNGQSSFQTLENVQYTNRTQNTDNSISPERNIQYSNNRLSNQSKPSTQRQQSAESNTPKTNTNRNEAIFKDKRSSLFAELAHLNKLERQEDQLKQMLLKQTDQLQSKTKPNENLRYSSQNIRINDVSQNNNNNKQTKSAKQLKEKSKLYTSRSTNHLLGKQKQDDTQRQLLQNQSLFLQNKMIEDLVQQGLYNEGSKKITSIQKNQFSQPNQLSSNLKSHKFILPKINKQSKVSLLANEIY